MKELIEEGKIKYWGVSNAPIDYIRHAHAICPITCVENQYSMVFREAEKELFNVLEELNIGFVVYSPLGNGFLSRKYNKDTKYKEGDFRKNMRRFSSEVLEHNQAVLDLLKEITDRKNATRAQIVLAWELLKKNI